MDNIEPQFLTLDELRTILGIGRTVAYELARHDKLPVPTIRVGRRMLFSRVALDAVLHRQHAAA